MSTFQVIRKNIRGISMPEVMASITVMAVLAGTGVTSAVNQISRSRIIATMDEMKSISLALDQYHQDNPGNTISTITTLVTYNYLTEGFTQAPDSDLKTDWKEDAWGNPYKLTPPSIDADGDYLRGSLESAGPNGIMTDDSTTTSVNEAADNIKITLEPMITSN